MTALLINEEAKAEIERIVKAARENVIPWDKLREIAVDDRDKPTAMLALSERPVAERPHGTEVNYGMTFAGGVTAAISFEEQPAGILRHCSFATGKPGKNRLLHPIMLDELCRLFGLTGFPPHPQRGRAWVEEYRPDFFAVNVVEVEQPREGPATVM